MGVVAQCLDRAGVAVGERAPLSGMINRVTVEHLEDLNAATTGVLPNQLLSEAVAQGWIQAGELRIPEESVQPASLDLRLGPTAYRIRCSFLPDDEAVEDKVKDLTLDKIDLRDDGAVLEAHKPYLIPLAEQLELPPFVRAKANPKSSTGRLDVFTRVITDHSYRFDDVRAGYEGRLYLEVVPLSFTVRVRQGIALNQLRLIIGQPRLSDDQLREHHRREPILYRRGRPATDSEFATADGLFLSLDLQGDDQQRVGHRARVNTRLLDMARVGTHRVEDYWEPVHSELRDRLILDPERFYLLLSEESVRIPPGLASEMTAYDPTSGELRTHYAGFFDPGFGF
ncbi:MAG: 2'-deoxycytidine 5'-triphosphate deaminase, partial [Actinobacteria bacterium]|nr:2'-deoxycytidine 5'-triphosphate deaminase [Actinomycetota bacterium]